MMWAAVDIVNGAAVEVPGYFDINKSRWKVSKKKMDDDLWLHIAIFLDGDALLLFPMIHNTTRRLFKIYLKFPGNFEKVFRIRINYAERIIRKIAQDSDGIAINGHAYQFMCTCGAGIGTYAWARYKIYYGRKKRPVGINVTQYVSDILSFMETVGRDTRYYRRTCCHLPENGLTDGTPIFDQCCQTCDSETNIYRFKEYDNPERHVVICLKCTQSAVYQSHRSTVWFPALSSNTT